MALAYRDYLVQFKYEAYCQGYEWVTQTLLVRRCETKYEAFEKVRATGLYLNCKEFVDLSID